MNLANCSSYRKNQKLNEATRNYNLAKLAAAIIKLACFIAVMDKLVTIKPISAKQQASSSHSSISENKKDEYKFDQQIKPRSSLVQSSKQINNTGNSVEVEKAKLIKRLNTIEELFSENRFAEAQPLIRLSLEDQSINWSQHQTEEALILLYKGGASYILGNSLDAEQTFQKARQKLSELQKRNPQLEIQTLNLIASLYLKAKNYDKAYYLLSQAREIGIHELETNDPQIGITLANLGHHAIETRRPSEARHLLKQAIEILTSKSTYASHLLTASNNLYALEVSEGNLLGAESLFSLLQSSIQRSVGKADPHLATLYYNAAAFYYYLRQNNDLVLSYTRSGLAAQRRFLISQLPKLAIGKREQFLDTVQKRGEAEQWLYWWTESFQGSARLALETSLNSKGLIQDLHRKQSLLLKTDTPYSKLTTKINSLMSEYANINTLSDRRRKLQEEIEKLQEDLYLMFPIEASSEVTLDDITSCLPVDSVLIEIRKYRHFLGDFNSDGQHWGEVRYVALILKPDQTVSTVQLGAAAPIESAIHNALKASAEGTSDAYTLWAQVSDLLIRPLTTALAGTNQWFISPDDELNRVPFAALPVPEDPAKLLGQSVQLRLLTTGRDLLRQRQSAKPAQPSIVLANPSFDRGKRFTNTVELASRSAKSQSRSADLAAKYWVPLPASADEGKQIGTLLETRPITGIYATTNSLQQLNSPRVLHIATHAFFVGDAENKLSDSSLAVQEQSVMFQPFRSEDPQLRSGLVLAGANQPDADPTDDGYLTASEVVELQLDGTEMVVLSACSTGQGDIRTGEGVYGLQRALTVAGARSTLLSLWKVGDAATAEFMIRFYKRLKAGEGRADALAAVQAEFRNGSVKSSSGDDWSNPYFWAAWQLTGDWGPIPEL